MQWDELAALITATCRQRVELIVPIWSTHGQLWPPRASRGCASASRTASSEARGGDGRSSTHFFRPRRPLSPSSNDMEIGRVQVCELHIVQRHHIQGIMRDHDVRTDLLGITEHSCGAGEH